MLKRLIVLLAALGFMWASPAFAKRAAPEPVEVVHEGVKYVAVHFGDSDAKVIEARDAATDARLWVVELYRVDLQPGLEKDVQDVFVTSIEVDGDTLKVENERGETFEVDLGTHNVVSKRIHVAEAYRCETDAECVNTCAHGAVNKAWFLANKDALGDCKDGCSSKGTQSAQCIDAVCVAFKGGQRIDHCTQKKVWFYQP